MSPIQVAISGVCRDIGANPSEWRGFADITLVGLALLLAALPPELTMGEFAEALSEAFGSEG